MNEKCKNWWLGDEMLYPTVMQWKSLWMEGRTDGRTGDTNTHTKPFW